MKKLGVLLTTAVLAIAMAGCHPTYISRRHVHNRSPPLRRHYHRHAFRGYSGKSYGVVRDRHRRIIRRHGEVWGTFPSGTHGPRHSPRNPYRR